MQTKREAVKEKRRMKLGLFKIQAKLKKLDSSPTINETFQENNTVVPTTDVKNNQVTEFNAKDGKKKLRK